MAFDLLIRNGTIVDGSGDPPFVGDVGIAGGRIAAMGRAGSDASTVIDATGLTVAPGLIDGHTHFDGQLSWDRRAEPMLEHGVTTIVTGNCSLTFAPLRRDQRERMIRMFGQIEQIPLRAFEAGVDWQWETFGEWIEHHSTGLGINVAPLVGHSALRMWAMGEDAHTRAATPAEVERMCRELRAARRAGAVGLSLSHVDTDERGKPVPSRLADADEVAALCDTLGETPGSMLQIVPEYYSVELMCRRVTELAALSKRSGIATTLAPLLYQTPGMVDEVLPVLEDAWAGGARVYAQVQPRGIDVHFRLCEWSFVLGPIKAWREVFKKPRSEQIEQLRDSAARAALAALAYPDDDDTKRAQLDGAIITESADPALVGRRLADVAAERSTTTPLAMIDVALAEDLQTRFTRFAPERDAELLDRLIVHPAVLIGASDAGAHVRSFSTYGDGGYVYRRFVRDRASLRPEQALRALTHDQAVAWGLPDRGRLAVDAAADVVIFDPATFDRGPDVDVADLPAGHRRYLRHSVGVDTTIVNGAVAWTAAAGYTGAAAGTFSARG